VSTILDALKRVQRDREQARPMDLRESLTASEPSPRRKRSTRSGRWPLLIAVLVLSAFAAAYPRVQALFADGEDDLLELALAAPAPRPGLGSPPPAPEATRAPLASAEPVARETLEPEAVVPSAPPAPAPGYPIAQDPPRRTPRVARGVPDPNAQRGQSLSATAGERPAPGGTGTPSAAPPQDTPSDEREPVGKPATRTYPSLPRLPTRTRDVARASEAKPPAGVSARDAAKPATPEADDFPEITVANVVWHPEADRRRASVTIDQTPLADAREGDILKGIEVEKIEPGAVEFKLGSELKTVRIGP